MDKSKGLKILEIIDQHHVEVASVVNRTVEEIINELKRDARTYRQVEEDLLFIKKEFNYMHGNNNEHLFDAIKKVLEREKNDLPLTKCSMT